jgi:hypothetical protein
MSEEKCYLLQYKKEMIIIFVATETLWNDRNGLLHPLP